MNRRFDLCSAHSDNKQNRGKNWKKIINFQIKNIRKSTQNKISNTISQMFHNFYQTINFFKTQFSDNQSNKLIFF